MPTQLSLFSEPESPETARRPIRRRAGPSAGTRRAVPAEEAPPLDLFSTLPPKMAPNRPAEPVEISVVVSAPPDIAETKTFAPQDLDTTESLAASEAEEDEPGRIRFDPTVWQLRSESGDFIHIRTGEVREEDGFLFAAPASDDPVLPDEWDLPQESGE